MVDGRTNRTQRRIDGRGRNGNKCFLPPLSHVRNEGAYSNLEPRVSPGNVRNAQQSAVAGRGDLDFKEGRPKPKCYRNRIIKI